MRKKRADQAPSKMAKLLTVLAVLMAIIMLVFLGRMVNELHRVFARDPYSIIDYDLQQGDYAGMITEYYHRGFDVAPFSGVHDEEYYIAQYADAAFQHQFYEPAASGRRGGRRTLCRADGTRPSGQRLAGGCHGGHRPPAGEHPPLPVKKASSSRAIRSLARS